MKKGVLLVDKELLSKGTVMTIYSINLSIKTLKNHRKNRGNHVLKKLN